MYRQAKARTLWERTLWEFCWQLDILLSARLRKIILRIDHGKPGHPTSLW